MDTIELRENNLLKAVVEGTNANAHLVARNGLVHGIQHAAEQYHISIEQVLAAIKFYLNNQTTIDSQYNSSFGQHGHNVHDADEFLKILRDKKSKQEAG